MLRKIIFILLILITFTSLINSFEVIDDATDDNEKVEKPQVITNILSGKMTKVTTVWRFEMTYNGKSIKGEFNRNVPFNNLPKSKYNILISIDDSRLNGYLYHKQPFIGNDNYDIEIRYGDENELKGEIKKKYKKVYRQDELTMYLNNKEIIGTITYGRKFEEKIYRFSSKKIKFSLDGISKFENALRTIKKYNFNFNDKKIAGSSVWNKGITEYRFQTSDTLTDEELFYFLFLEIYHKIDEYNKEAMQQEKEKLEKGNFK